VKKHGNIHAIKADVTSKPALEAAAEHVKQKHGYVNLVIANSGINGPDLYSLPPDASFEQVRHYLQKIETQEYHDTFAVNTTGVMLTLVAFLDLLNKGNEACNVEQHSQFLAVTSVGGYNRMSMAGLAYNASKAAANHLIKQFATRLAPFRIRANAIAPGGKWNFTYTISRQI
jgi:NAD(P)-dependent dehydrogenase (short-subunit alcohol dehydrogenase family)